MEPIKDADTFDISGCAGYCYGGYSMEKEPDGFGNYVKAEDYAKLREQLRMSKESEECHAFNARAANNAYVALDAKLREVTELAYAYPPNEPFAADGETWKQRAERAEARIAEEEKQEPDAYIYPAAYGSRASLAKENKPVAWDDSECKWYEHKLYTHPIPPADVAELQKELAKKNRVIQCRNDDLREQAQRIAELERKLNEGYTAVASGINADLNQQVKDLMRKLAEQQTLLNNIYKSPHDDEGAEYARTLSACAVVEELNALLAKAREEGRKEAISTSLVKELKGMRKSLVNWRTQCYPDNDQSQVVDRDYPTIAAMLAAAPEQA